MSSIIEGKTIKSTKVEYLDDMVRALVIYFTDGTNLTIDSYNRDSELDFIMYDNESKRASNVHPENLNT